jgi:excisionase family DNA binding protein
MPALKKKYRTSAAPIAPAIPATAAPGYMNVREAATYLSIAVFTIRELIADGKLRHVKLGKRFIVKREDLDQLWETLAVAA